MNDLNKKLAYGIGAGAAVASLGVGMVAGNIYDKKMQKEKISALKSVKGNSKTARKTRIQINNDFNKERKSIDNTVNLATAGAVIVSGGAGIGLSKIL